MSFNIKDTESKVTPAKKTLDLKNISVSDLRLVDTDSGEDISQQVIDFSVALKTDEELDVPESEE